MPCLAAGLVEGFLSLYKRLVTPFSYSCGQLSKDMRFGEVWKWQLKTVRGNVSTLFRKQRDVTAFLKGFF